MSLLRNISQLGLPLGFTLLVVACIETNILFYAYLKDLGVLLYELLYVGQNKEDIQFYVIEQVIVPIYKSITTFGFLWIGTIFMGSWKMLLAWIASAILYLLFIFCSVLISFIQTFDLAIFYLVFVYACLFIYQIVVGIWAYQDLRANLVLQPLGKGLLYIWTYLCNELQTAAQFFLVSEMMIDGFYLLSRQFVAHAFGISFYYGVEVGHPAVVIEQLVMTGIRFLIDAIGLFCVMKEKRNWVQIWCAGVGIQILISTSLFVFLTVMWRGVDMTYTLAVLIMFPIHLLFRCVVLYFCLRYTRINFSNMVL